MSKTDEPAKLTCSGCGHENEPERVYCHNCGAKLDRSLLPKVEKKSETAEEARARVSKMMNPRRTGSAYNHVKIGVQMVIFALLVAFIFLVWQKPDSVPEARADHIPALDPGELWDRLMAAPTANQITISEEDMNVHLRRIIKASEGGAGIKFVRTVVDFQPGTVTIFVERDVWGISMISSVTYKPLVRGGKMTADIVDTRIGRLGVHPESPAMFPDWAVSGISNAFDKQIKQIDRLSEIRVLDGQIQFISKPLTQ